MQFNTRSILGSLASFGVAFVLISNAGAASAQEAPPATSSDEATLGEPLYVERPAPRPDPANELGAEAAPAASAPAPAPRPAPAPSPTPAPAAAPRSTAVAASPAPAAVQAARPATASSPTPARATEVQGVQIVRPASPGDVADTTLAFTGADLEVGLTVTAAVLLALGWALIRLSRSPRLA